MKKPSHIPAYTLPQRNRRVVLAHRPTGISQAHDFAFDEVAVPDPGVNQFVVRNLHLSVDPAQRAWASTESNYSNTVPFGGPMRALAVGIVLRSRDATVEEGDFLYG